MIKTLIPIFLLLSSSVSAKICFKYENKKVQIKWEAYKTPAKVGVGGRFKNFSIKSEKTDSLSSLIRNTSFEIDTKSVFTKNSARDKKIMASFFLDGAVKIHGKVKMVKKKEILITLNLNNKQSDISMKYVLDKMKLKAEGIIDILDFMMSKNLKMLSKVCSSKHQGKTWSEVKIMLEAEFTSC